MLPPPADRPKLATVLDQLSASVEELMLSGLTTGSESTRQTLSIAMQEAARLRLLRLGSTLRGSAEELGRFTRQDPAFSRRRLAFFLNRAWLLSRGIARSIEAGDEAEYDRLAWTPPTRPLPRVEAVCLGALKKVAAGSFAAFDFRLRATADAGPIVAGQRLTWSAVFPLKPGVDIPPEGYLLLQQKQKFAPGLFLDRAAVVIEEAAMSADDSGVARVVLTDASTVLAGGPFADWPRFLDWSPAPALDRLVRHRPGPLDLDTELQEEVVLRDYEIGPPGPPDDSGQVTYPMRAGRLDLHAVVAAAADGKALKEGFEGLRKVKKGRPPLFGLMHYERCRLVFQPLTAFNEAGPDYLTISKQSINKAALLKALSFT